MFHFFAYLSRMKLIERWSLMRSTQKENVQEHSLQVAMVAHALAVVKNKFFEGRANPERVVTLALYHDASEVITGDLPTPVKYFNSDIREAYKDIEKRAEKQLLALLPQELYGAYEDFFDKKDKDKSLWDLVKAADTLCGYIKCLEEEAAGNKEFKQARETLEKKLKDMNRPEVMYFMENFIPSFSMSLDELSTPFR